ncbi:DUF2938 domain-containing protein [Bordetella petrii]|uniref:DUF2938 domain-containing protein n=1 Tax=Bordetella petrii TaxID=94624 RepID=UPI001E64F2A2|nr:DUF2938 domain-containing protein [Bordetella petrii]MCD0501653.1 DUF2938 domain-containing protein [Bordetella petrii]
MIPLEDLARIVLVGVGATVVMDGWLALMKALGVPTLPFGLIGRWVGHLRHGRFAHAAIAQAPPVPHEQALGWAVHYGVGIAFAVLLTAVWGTGWLHQPTLLPAIAVGAATVVIPLCVMQPAMGAGFASSRTPSPVKNCLRSLATHTAFGVGLYLAAAALAMVWS